MIAEVMDIDPEPKVLGVWLVGARGSKAAMTMVCARLLAQGTIEPVGLLTERAPFNSLPFAKVEALRFGGCDLRAESLEATLDRFRADQILPPNLYADAVSV